MSLSNTEPDVTDVEPKSKPIEVNDLSQFVYILTRWHEGKVKELAHLLTIPDEGHVSVSIIEDGKENEYLMQGEMLKGFRAGLQVALTALGTLPFGVTFEEPEEAVNASPEAQNAAA